jgi:hypothetical protein
LLKQVVITKIGKFNSLNFSNPIVNSSELKDENLLESKSTKETLYSEDQLGYYLAGLIEGDGSIIVPMTSRNDKGKLLYPKIKITFVIKDAPLAEKINNVLGQGTLEYPKNVNYLNLLIQDISTLYKVTVLINGKMRTPKIEALHRLIDWLNDRSDQKEKLIKLGLDTSSLVNNAWLSGFLEADGNFYCNYSINASGIANSIKYYMRISQRAVYTRKNDPTKSEISFLPLMETIANSFDVSKVNLINRKKSNYTEEAYEVRTVKRESCEKLINYLSKYPLFSSKYLDFLCWSEIHEINKSKLYKTLEGTNKLISLKSKMNTSRTEFDWKHLDNFYK